MVYTRDRSRILTVKSSNIFLTLEINANILNNFNQVLHILTGKPIGKKPLGRPRGIWEENVRMYLEEMGVNTRNWIDSAQDREYWRALVNKALNLQFP